MARRSTRFVFNEEDRGLSALTEVQPLIAHDSRQSTQAREERREMVHMQTLDSLMLAADVPFDDTNPQHMKTLEELWEFSFPGEPFSRSSRHWSTLGFQGLDPTTDLRGAGYMALQHLHNFVTTFQVLPLSCPSDFPLAIASINCSAMLQSYFGLNLKIVVPVPEMIRRSCRPNSEIRRALLEMSSKHPQATFQLQQIHVQLLHALARQWARTHTPTTTILDFPACLQATYRHFHLSVAATARPWMLHELLANLQKPPWLAERVIDPDSPCMSATPMISFLLMLVTQLGCCGHSPVSDDSYHPLPEAPTKRMPVDVPPLIAAL